MLTLITVGTGNFKERPILKSDLSKVTAGSCSDNFAMISAMVCGAHSLVTLSKNKYSLLVLFFRKQTLCQSNDVHLGINIQNPLCDPF